MQKIPLYKLGRLGIMAPFKFAGDPLHFLHQGFASCGDTFQMKLFREFVVTRDPGFFRHVLQQQHRNFKKGSSSKMLRPVLGNGLVTSDGDFWLRQRRLVQPAFHRERLQELFLAMGKLTTAFLDEMEAFRGKSAVDIDAKMMSVTSDIALKTLFGNMTTPYTRQVVEEGLRLYPPAWTMTREATVDQEIEGFSVKAGTSVFLSVFELHRNPNLWKDPLTFNPDNFSPENVKDRPKFNYLPFGAGPRICIGQQFAMMEMQLLLAALVKRFDFRSDPSHPVSMHPQIVLKSTNGIKLFVR